MRSRPETQTGRTAARPTGAAMGPGWRACALAVALVLAGCGGAPSGPQAGPSGPSLGPTTSPTPEPIPSAMTPPAAPCPEPSGRIERLTYPGRVVQEEVPVRVYLPPCYDASGQRYPTVYLLHGKPYNDAHWDDLGADEAVDQALAAGTWPPILLVMPLQPEPVFTNSDGGPWSYEAEMIEGLVPFVDQALRTLPSAAFRAVAGISRGGVWALEIAFRNPQVFDAVAALSPALAVNHARPAYDPFEITRASAVLPSRIYLGAGEEDWARRMSERLSQALDEAGAPHTLVLSPGDHQDPTWEAALVPMLAFLVEPWSPAAALPVPLETQVSTVSEGY
jgi:enterochelin esterase-like enzyme